jgi:mercuric ion transport protein
MKEVRLASGSAVLAAVTASLCCIGPLLSIVLGLGAFSAAAVFESARPYLFVIAALSLALGFYRGYFRSEQICAAGEGCVFKPMSWTGRAGLWISAGLVLAFALWPYYAGGLLNRLHASAQVAGVEAGTQKATFKVTGMSCASCEATIKFVLDDTPRSEKSRGELRPERGGG